MRETRAARIEARDGLLFVRIRPGVHQTLDDARENLDACTLESGGERCGLLLDISQAVPLDPTVRHFYRGPAVDGVCSALALVVEVSPLGRMMGNVYMRVAKLGVPTRIFDREQEAISWLKVASRGQRVRA